MDLTLLSFGNIDLFNRVSVLDCSLLTCVLAHKYAVLVSVSITPFQFFQVNEG